ncbi:MAG: Sec-independent protein translocase subunit TatA [Actinomycetota bacterium]|nr:Sec-independent protein translocase subunit TatA [Actinomycetota bacterium]
MRGLFEGWHIIILLVVVLVLFGYKRLPDAARSLGRSMRIFKSEVDTMRDDSKPKDKPTSGTPPLSGRIVDEPDAPRSASPESTGDERR